MYSPSSCRKRHHFGWDADTTAGTQDTACDTLAVGDTVAASSHCTAIARMNQFHLSLASLLHLQKPLVYNFWPEVCWDWSRRQMVIFVKESYPLTTLSLKKKKKVLLSSDFHNFIPWFCLFKRLYLQRGSKGAGRQRYFFHCLRRRGSAHGTGVIEDPEQNRSAAPLVTGWCTPFLVSPGCTTCYGALGLSSSSSLWGPPVSQRPTLFKTIFR